MAIYYHYTTKEACEKMVAKGVRGLIAKVTGHDGWKVTEKGDFGSGYYLTPIEPGSMSRRDLQRKLGISYERTEYFIEVHVHGNAVNDCRGAPFQKRVNAVTTAEFEWSKHGPNV